MVCLATLIGLYLFLAKLLPTVVQCAAGVQQRWREGRVWSLEFRFSLLFMPIFVLATALGGA